MIGVPVGSELHPLGEMAGEIFEMRNATNMLAILRVVFQAGLESVQGGDAKEIHFGFRCFSHGIQDKPQC